MDRGRPTHGEGKKGVRKKNCLAIHPRGYRRIPRVAQPSRRSRILARAAALSGLFFLSRRPSPLNLFICSIK